MEDVDSGINSKTKENSLNANLNSNKKSKSQKEKKEKRGSRINCPDFTYLKKKEDPSFTLSFQDFQNPSLQPYDDKYLYVICILIPDNSLSSSNGLYITLEGIINNSKELKKIGIDLNNILICVFVQNNSTLVPKEELENLQDNKKFLFVPYKFNKNFDSVNILLACQKEMSDLIDIKKIFYFCIAKRFIIKNPLLVSFMYGGFCPQRGSLVSMIKRSFTNEKEKPYSIVVPATEIKAEGIFGRVQEYENVHYNGYDMNFYALTGYIPISSNMNLIHINEELLLDLQNFYDGEINPGASLQYHDYLLGIYLANIGYNVNYVSSIEGVIEIGELQYLEYMQNYTKKYGGNFSTLYQLFKSFLKCDYCSAQSKIFLFFQLIGMLFEFLLPSFMCMVIYEIFYDAFDKTDPLPCTFVTTFYAVLLLLSGALSFASKNSINLPKLNFVFFILFEVYYLFILICSILAMHHVKKNKFNDPYKFNTGAVASIIIINFILGIIPMILNIKKFWSNILNMLFYLIFGASSSTSHFLMSYIFNASDNIGEAVSGKSVYRTKEERKGFVLLYFFLSNGLFGFLIMVLTNRKKRVNSVLALAIIFTIYNFVKMMGIVFERITNGMSIDKAIDVNNFDTGKTVYNEICKRKRFLKQIEEHYNLGEDKPGNYNFNSSKENDANDNTHEIPVPINNENNSKKSGYDW